MSPLKSPAWSVAPDNLSLHSARGYEVGTFIAPFWDALAIDPGAVYVQDPGSAFVVEYYHVSRKGDTSDPGSWEVILYDNNSILFQYQDVDLWGIAADNGRSATVGIQGDAITGLQYSSNTPALSPGLAITADLFDLVLGSHAWATIAPATVGPLARDTGADLEMTVAIPPGAAPGATDTATLTAPSRGEGAKWLTAFLTTTAEVFQQPRHDLFLPLIARS